VRVKKIKSRGKGNPVALMKSGLMLEEDDDDDDDDEEEEEGEEFGGQFGDSEEGEEDDIHDEEDEEDGEGDDGTSNESAGGRETIERLKDDLFAEDEETLSKSKTSNITAKL
jgi:U3 small nucleolar RNA-associated protein MPP10